MRPLLRLFLKVFRIPPWEKPVVGPSGQLGYWRRIKGRNVFIPIELQPTERGGAQVYEVEVTLPDGSVGVVSVPALADIGILLSEDGRSLDVRFDYDEKLVNRMREAKRELRGAQWDSIKKRWVIPLTSQNLDVLFKHFDNIHISGKVLEAVERVKAEDEEAVRQAQAMIEELGDFARGWAPNVLKMTRGEIARLASLGAISHDDMKFLLGLGVRSLPRALLSERQLQWLTDIQGKVEKFFERNPKVKAEMMRSELNRLKALVHHLSLLPPDLAEKFWETISWSDIGTLKTLGDVPPELLKHFAYPEGYKTDVLRNNDLEEFQKKGVLWLMGRKRGVLSFSTGLGKTYTFLTAAFKLQEIYRKGDENLRKELTGRLKKLLGENMEELVGSALSHLQSRLERWLNGLATTEGLSEDTKALLQESANAIHEGRFETAIRKLFGEGVKVFGGSGEGIYPQALSQVKRELQQAYGKKKKALDEALRDVDQLAQHLQLYWRVYDLGFGRDPRRIWDDLNDSERAMLMDIYVGAKDADARKGLMGLIKEPYKISPEGRQYIFAQLDDVIALRQLHQLGRKDGMRVLLLAPSTTFNQLEKSIKAIMPDKRCAFISSKESEARRAETYEKIGREGGVDVVITTYDIMRLDADKLSRLGFGIVIADEASRLKGVQSQTHEAILKHFSTTPFIWGSTATPFNTPDGLYGILEVIAPSRIFRSNFPYADFVENFTEYETITVPTKEGRRTIKKKPVKLKTLATLRAFGDLFFTRSYDSPDVKLEETLPGKENIVADEFGMTRPQRALFERLQREYIELLSKADNPLSGEAWGRAMTLLQDMALACVAPHLVDANYAKGETDPDELVNPKFEMLAEILREKYASGSTQKGTVVFCHRLAVLDEAKRYLIKEGLVNEDEVAVVTGELISAKGRQIVDEAIAKAESGQVKVLLLSDVAAEGLNLQHCADTLVHLDFPFGRADILAQREGRVYRLGQTDKVACHAIIVNDFERHWYDYLRQRADEMLGTMGAKPEAGETVSREAFLASWLTPEQLEAVNKVRQERGLKPIPVPAQSEVKQS